MPYSATNVIGGPSDVAHVRQNVAMNRHPLPLTPVLQRYTWGMNSPSCKVAQLTQTSSFGPFAEAWYGAHHSAPSQALIDGVARPLDRVLAEQAGGSSLPFLLKVLSVESPLSIQLHPDKESGSRLHSLNPSVYPDDNHKPEIAVALTPLTLLYGLRADELVTDFAEERPALNASWGPHATTALSRIESILRAPKEALKLHIQALLHQVIDTGPASDEDRWFVRCVELHGTEDAGVLFPYIMNLVTVQPGHCLYIPPRVLHAYLEGELVECMANSDNVVRCGLTKKHCDVDTLLSLIDPQQGFDDRQMQAPTPSGAPDMEIRCPLGNFGLTYTQSSSSTAPHRFTKAAHTIALVIHGRAYLSWAGGGFSCNQGNAVYIPGAAEHAAWSLQPGSQVVIVRSLT